MVSKFYDFGERMIFGSGIWLKSIDFSRVVGDFWSGEMGNLFDLFFVKIDDFWVSSMKGLWIKGLRGFWSGMGWFFGVVRMGEMLDFSGFARSSYRSDCLDGFGWNVSEMLILQGVCG